jgi:RNA polymerase sigma-70 factor (ECF subfamily)
MLRARAARREEPLDVHVPDPIVGPPDTDDPEHQAVLAESVGLALLVVLDTLSPNERLAFVLHDLFGVPFAQIAPMIDRTPPAAKQLASRARHRVRGNPPVSNVDPSQQREIVDAFLAAARDGDLGRLLALLDPEVVLRADAGDGLLGPSRLVRGASAVGQQATRFGALARYARPVIVNGAPGFLAVADGRALSLLTVVVRDRRIVEIDVLADPDRLARLDLSDVTG